MESSTEEGDGAAWPNWFLETLAHFYWNVCLILKTIFISLWSGLKGIFNVFLPWLFTQVKTVKISIKNVQNQQICYKSIIEGINKYWNWHLTNMIQEWLLLGGEGSLVLVPTAWEQSSGTLASSTLEALYKSTNTNTNANTNAKTNTNTDKIPIQIKIKIPIQTPIQIQIQIQNRSAPYNLICCLIHREVDKNISVL